ncbi:MAG: hypothetical protein LBR12_06200 [Opitutaceae bacterium]|jgi:hypothetical protein|nr:hypothetical protein [Opitutaceae bacterium]
MKKIFHLVVVSAVSAGALLQAAETGIVIARADRTASVKRGDVVAAGSTINVAGGTVRGSAFPGANFALSGKDASLKVDGVTINAQGGFITQQSAALTLASGDLISTVSRTDGVVTNYSVTVAQGTASAELTQNQGSASGIDATKDNVVAASYKGVLYFTFNHGVPLPNKPDGTKEGEPKVIVAISEGMALVYDLFKTGGELVPISALSSIGGPQAIIDALGEFSAGEIVPPPDVPPGTISPSW